MYCLQVTLVNYIDIEVSTVLYPDFTACCYSNLSLQVVACLLCHENNCLNIIVGFGAFFSASE